MAKRKKAAVQKPADRDGRVVREGEGSAPPSSGRRFPRIHSKNSVVLRKLGAHPRGELTVTKVVGLGGCSFVHPSPQGVGETLFLSILVGQELGEAKVRVAYERPHGDGTYEIGVEFLEISERDRALLAHLVAKSGVHDLL